MNLRWKEPNNGAQKPLNQAFQQIYRRAPLREPVHLKASEAVYAGGY